MQLVQCKDCKRIRKTGGKIDRLPAPLFLPDRQEMKADEGVGGERGSTLPMVKRRDNGAQLYDARMRKKTIGCSSCCAIHARDGYGSLF